MVAPTASSSVRAAAVAAHAARTLSGALTALVDASLEPDPTARPTVDEALNALYALT